MAAITQLSSDPSITRALSDILQEDTGTLKAHLRPNSSSLKGDSRLFRYPSLAGIAESLFIEILYIIERSQLVLKSGD